MFKFFRKYNKWILTVGMSLLMLVFLIEPALSMFRPDESKRAIGTINGKTVTVGQQRQAAAEINLLQSVAPILVADQTREEPLRWMLMLHDAQRLGLSASQGEAEELAAQLKIDEAAMGVLAKRFDATRDFVRETLRHWIVIQRYKELVYGLAHVPTAERLAMLGQASQFFQIGYYPGAMMVIQASRGTPRVSPPLVQRFLQDQRATVRLAAVPVTADRYAAKIETADPKLVQELFEKHKNDLPGAGQPYGFGYRFPDRVKLEYLSVPLDRVLQRVQVDEADLLTYYDQHQDQFKAPPATQPATTQPDAAAPQAVRPYAEVRSQILRDLRQQRARELADQIIKTATALLIEDARAIPESGGYRQIPAGWNPMPLRQVAERVQQQFGVLPDVRRLDDQWLAQEELANLPGIGQSRLAGRPGAPFVTYVHSAKELAPKDDNALLPMRLQVGMPSQALADMMGTRYLFRLIAAEPARTPASLDEVRAQVERDAKRLAGYRQLLQEQAQWVQRARTEDLAKLAQELGASVIQPEAFSRRDVGYSGTLAAPEIPQIGQSEVFVDKAFELADRAAAQGPADAAKPEQRIDAIPLDSKLTLYLVRIDGFEPITRSEYARVASQPQVSTWINQALMASAGSEVEDPLSLKALEKRVGFVSERGAASEE